MIATQSEAARSVQRPKISKASCPLCGEQMRMVNDSRRMDEPFSWFECTEKSCPGWIVQTPELASLYQ